MVPPGGLVPAGGSRPGRFTSSVGAAMLRRRLRRHSLITPQRPSHQQSGIESLEGRTLLTGAGGLDPSFGGDGIVTRNLVTTEGAVTNDTAVQADGKIVAVGNAGGDMFVARFTPDGALDPSFGAGGGMVPFDFSYNL